MIIPLSSALVEGIGFNLQKRKQRIPCGDVSSEQVTCKGCGISL